MLKVKPQEKDPESQVCDGAAVFLTFLDLNLSCPKPWASKASPDFCISSPQPKELQSVLCFLTSPSSCCAMWPKPMVQR